MTEDFDVRYPHARSQETKPHWPADVKPISVDGLDLLGLDDRGKIYWNGKPIKTEKGFKLTGAQTFFAILASVATAASAFIELLQFLR